MKTQRRWVKYLNIMLVLVLAFTLASPLANQWDRTVLAAPLAQGSNAAMQTIIDQLGKAGYTILGSGSWITNKKFRDPLKVRIGVEPSDFDMRIVIRDPGASPQQMADTWKKAGDKLKELVTEAYKNEPGAAEKILKATNLYPPDQMMAGVSNNKEALERLVKYNRVPNLGITQVTKSLDPMKAVGGIYGEGSSASRQYKELTEGKLFGGTGRTSVSQIIAEEGIEKFSTKGQASVSRQWGEFVKHWLKDGDPKMAGKYAERMAKALDSARELRGLGNSPATQELRRISAMLKQGITLNATEMTQFEKLIARADQEAAILNKLKDVSASQRGLLLKAFEALNVADSTFGKALQEAIDKIGIDKLMTGLLAAGLTADAAAAAGAGDYTRIWANASWMLGLPAGIATEITNGLLEAAKGLGYSLTVGQQACDDLLAGIFVAGQRDAEARAYTMDQLLKEVKTEEGIRGFVDARAREAANRGWSGPATEASDWKGAEAITAKCYPLILANWQRERDALLQEYKALWRELTVDDAILVAEPDPAYLDPVTNQVTVIVTAQSLALIREEASGRAIENRLLEISKILTDDTARPIYASYLNWSPAPDDPANETSSSRSFTFTAPGEYQVKASVKVRINMQNSYAGLDRWQVRDGAVTIHVLKAEDMPLCGGGPTIKSASRTTLEREQIWALPGQVASPGTYITAAGDFSATDPMTGYRKEWVTGYNGMRECPECTCLPWTEVGSFEMAASGRIKAVIEAPLKVPWGLTNGAYNTGLWVFFEPKIGDNYGRSDKLIRVWERTNDNEDALTPFREEIEADVPGPGRISAGIEAAGGWGEFTGACYDQSYTAHVDVIAVGKNFTVNGETTLGIGDHIRTDGWGEAVIVTPWGGLRKLEPNTDVSIERKPLSPDADCQDWELKVNSGQLRIWSPGLQEAEGGTTVQAGSYTVKP